MIDLNFIRALEGGQKLWPYWPGGAKSGVTVASGYDLGHRTRKQLQSAGLSERGFRLLAPFLGLRGYKAKRALDAANRVPPAVSISRPDAEKLDEAACGEILEPLVSAYDLATTERAHCFEELPQEAKTVLASVAWQYGPNLKRRTPKFWDKAVRCDWQGMERELRQFGDRFPTRRNIEADYLTKILSA